MRQGLFHIAIWLLVCLISVQCVQQIEINTDAQIDLLVVDGSITDQSGPYEVRLSKITSIAGTAQPIDYETGAQVVLHDVLGPSEILDEVSPGHYQTNGTIQGQVGHSYFISIETQDGKTYQSKPDPLLPGGTVDQVDVEYKVRFKQEIFGQTRTDLFEVYVDAQMPPSVEEQFVRWRMTGTYHVKTFPELYLNNEQGASYTPYKDPFPCSGYIVVAFVPGGKLEQVGPCECCDCWASQYEKVPQISSSKLVQNGVFNQVKLGEVPINPATFYDKYLITIEQMSLSATAYNFFGVLRDQKQESGNLLQPTFGPVKGNIEAVNHSGAVTGLFWSSSVTKHHRFLYPEDVPFTLTPIEVVTKPCYDAYPNATTTIHPEWR